MRTMTPSRIVNSVAVRPSTAAPQPLPLAAGMHEDQHALVVDVEDPLGGELQGATPGRRVRMLTPGFDSSNDWAIGKQRRVVEFRVGRYQPGLSGRLDQPGGQAKVAVHAADEFDVLLRHRPLQYPAPKGSADGPSIQTSGPASAAQRDAGPRANAKAKRELGQTCYRRLERSLFGPADPRVIRLGP